MDGMCVLEFLALLTSNLRKGQPGSLTRAAHVLFAIFQTGRSGVCARFIQHLPFSQFGSHVLDMVLMPPLITLEVRKAGQIVKEKPNHPPPTNKRKLQKKTSDNSSLMNIK